MSKLIITGILCMVIFAGCGGPGTEEIVKKYDSYGSPAVNKAQLRISNFSVGKKGAIIQIVSDNPELNGISANVDLLSERFIVLDAENPTQALSVQTQTEPIVHNNEVVGYLSWLILQEPKAKVILVGFKGITAAESVEFETSPLFFIASLDEENTVAQLHGGPLGTHQDQKPGENKLFSDEHDIRKFSVRTGQLMYKDKEYAFRIGKVSKETDGTTRVYFVAPAFAEEYGKGQHGKIPFDTEIFVGDNRIPSENLMGIGDKFFYDSYTTTVAPDKIVIRCNNGGTIIFDGKTKAVIKE